MNKANTYANLLANGYSEEDISSMYHVQPDSVRRHSQRANSEFSQNEINNSKYGQESLYFDSSATTIAKTISNPVSADFSHVENVSLPSLPKAQQNTIADTLQIPGGSCAVISDLHVPYHNTSMLERFMQVMDTLHPKVRIAALIGDLLNFESISQHPKNEKQSTVEESLDIAGQVLIWLFQRFDVFYICSGNHDERIGKALNNPFSLESLVYAALKGQRFNCQLHITDRDYLLLGDNWLLGHPSNYSGLGGKTPSELADLEQRNIVTAHNHVIGMSASKSGRYLGIDCGHMTDPTLHTYIQRRLTKFARWNSGFVVIENGFSYQYTENFTDWSFIK